VTGFCVHGNETSGLSFSKNILHHGVDKSIGFQIPSERNVHCWVLS
jgi:hypothetical protein